MNSIVIKYRFDFLFPFFSYTVLSVFNTHNNITDIKWSISIKKNYNGFTCYYFTVYNLFGNKSFYTIFSIYTLVGTLQQNTGYFFLKRLMYLYLYITHFWYFWSYGVFALSPTIYINNIYRHRCTVTTR